MWTLGPLLYRWQRYYKDSRRGRIQNRDYISQSQDLENEVAVESHLPILVIDSVKRRRPSLPCFHQFVTGPQGTVGQINKVPDLEELYTKVNNRIEN